MEKNFSFIWFATVFTPQAWATFKLRERVAIRLFSFVFPNMLRFKVLSDAQFTLINGEREKARNDATLKGEVFDEASWNMNHIFG